MSAPKSTPEPSALRPAAAATPQTADSFPSEEAHERRWLELAQAIAAERGSITDDPTVLQPNATPGELVVIGSGIESVGFSSSDEILLREADKVFYCVADPVTMVWIKRLRPDAYDLYVLYDDAKLRYLTYMEMTEAMLYHVRRGQKVVAIYYGHPGIFVLSTHRAVRIARREGHRAVMRAAVSALDTLCADLGVDPSQPGLQTFEATGMLVRLRRPDPSLHLVLWQVGLVGDMGFRRAGFLNRGFPILLDFLEDVYGSGHEVVHYIGSRYPGIEPRIDRHTITTLRNPEVQAMVTGISTFYVPPKIAIAPDPVMMEKLGLAKPGREPVPEAVTTTAVGRTIDRYGPREMKAFEDFARFQIPAGYHWQEDTAAARFVLALREDGALRDLYTRNPAGAVAQWQGTHLSRHDRTLLSQRDAGSMQIAAKGVQLRFDGELRRVMRALFENKTLNRTLWRAVRSGGAAALERWTTDHGYRVDWSTIPGPLELTLRHRLAPWTGLYLAAEQQVSLFAFGRMESRAGDRIFLDGQPVKKPVFDRGILRWHAEAGNATNGRLQVDLTPSGSRRLIGTIWPAGGTPATSNRIVAVEHRLSTEAPLSALTGTYRTKNPQGRDLEVSVRPAFPRMEILLDGAPWTGAITVSKSSFKLDDVEVPFGAKVPVQGLPAPLTGTYSVRGAGLPPGATVTFSNSTVALSGGVATHLTIRSSRSSWRQGPAPLVEGSVSHLLDPLTLHPMLFGTVRSEPGAGPESSLAGMVPLGASEVAQLEAAPGLGLAPWAWVHLVRIAADTSQRGGLFLWHHWEKMASNLRRLRTVCTLARR